MDVWIPIVAVSTSGRPVGSRGFAQTSAQRGSPTIAVGISVIDHTPLSPLLVGLAVAVIVDPITDLHRPWVNQGIGVVTVPTLGGSISAARGREALAVLVYSIAISIGVPEISEATRQCLLWPLGLRWRHLALRGAGLDNGPFINGRTDHSFAFQWSHESRACLQSEGEHGKLVDCEFPHLPSIRFRIVQPLGWFSVDENGVGG